MSLTNRNQIDRPPALTKTAWPHEIRSITIDGQEVAYTDEGSGRALLFVHDGMWSFVWGQLLERLSSGNRVVTLDFPGSGLSGGEWTPSLEGDSRFLERFVDVLGLGEFTLVAHDLGGPVGLGLATRRPELISGLVLVNTLAWPPEKTALKAMFKVMSSAAVTRLNVATNFLYRMSSGNFGIGRHLDKESRKAFLAPYEDKAMRVRFHQLMRSARGEREYLQDLAERLGDQFSDKPVLTIYGERNDPFGFQERFKEMFPHAEEMVVAGGNHFPMCDAPDELAERIAV